MTEITGNIGKPINCSCECRDEEEQLRLVGEMVQEYYEKGRSLVQVLYMAQNLFGSLPLEVQKVVADKMHTPLSRVSGVVSFYSFFTTEAKGKHTIRVCLGTACYVRGGNKIVDRLEMLLGVAVGETTPDRVFTFEIARCIGACGLAPAVMIDDEVYKKVDPERLEEILAPYYWDAKQ